jgi:hypothetical protein
VHNDIEVKATVAGILAKEAFRIGFVNCSLQLDLLVPELAPDINVGGLGSHCKAHKQSAFDKLVRVVPHNFTIFAGAWF